MRHTASSAHVSGREVRCISTFSKKLTKGIGTRQGLIEEAECMSGLDVTVGNVSKRNLEARALQAKRRTHTKARAPEPPPAGLTCARAFR